MNQPQNPPPRQPYTSAIITSQPPRPYSDHAYFHLPSRLWTSRPCQAHLLLRVTLPSNPTSSPAFISGSFESSTSIIIILNCRTILPALNIRPLLGNSASDHREPHQTCRKYQKQPNPFPNQPSTTAFTTHHLLISDQLKLTTTPPSISVTAFTQLRTATQHHREVSLTPATHLCPFVDHRESPPSPPLSRQLPQTRTTPLRDLSRVTATWTHGSRWLISSMTALARRGEVRVFLSRAEEKRKKRLAQWPATTSTVISGSDDALALGAVVVAVVAP
ncbi:hypothetical protein LR48_Vigan10g216500 [Vigna angularis]|uniref:Uncharacterized protein n=1 Tax=Phaseolus angularis TaxID=3914 RepID=A0A0L9VMT7_PHAAN|nr:hypothetical protein LR48_Vigan10g216500 [Vigna angularis]